MASIRRLIGITAAPTLLGASLLNSFRQAFNPP